MASTKDGGYPFAAKAAQYRSFTLAGLQWSVKDAQEAAQCMRGCDPVAEAWYLDDVHTLLDELRRRKG